MTCGGFVYCGAIRGIPSDGLLSVPPANAFADQPESCIKFSPNGLIRARRRLRGKTAYPLWDERRWDNEAHWLTSVNCRTHSPHAHRTVATILATIAARFAERQRLCLTGQTVLCSCSLETARECAKSGANSPLKSRCMSAGIIPFWKDLRLRRTERGQYCHPSPSDVPTGLGNWRCSPLAESVR